MNLANLKKTRIMHNLTQKEVADILGCATNVYARYERNEREPSIDLLLQLSHCFHVSVDYLLGNEISMTEYEHEFLASVRNADQRAREDALNMLNAHRIESKKEDLT